MKQLAKYQNYYNTWVPGYNYLQLWSWGPSVSLMTVFSSKNYVPFFIPVNMGFGLTNWLYSLLEILNITWEPIQVPYFAMLLG